MNVYYVWHSMWSQVLGQVRKFFFLVAQWVEMGRKVRMSVGCFTKTAVGIDWNDSATGERNGGGSPIHV